MADTPALRKFKYTKDNGEVSERILHDVGKVPAQNVKALDLTDYTEDERHELVGLWGEYNSTVAKDYRKLEMEFRKKNFITFEQFLMTKNWNKDVPIQKSFKFSGLEELP